MTDSTSGVEGSTAQGPGSTVVAQNVHFGTLSFGDNVTITQDEFYEMPATAVEVARGLRRLLPEGAEPYIARFGTASRVYAGPGTVGIALVQAEEQFPEQESINGYRSSRALRAPHTSGRAESGSRAAHGTVAVEPSSPRQRSLRLSPLGLRNSSSQNPHADCTDIVTASSHAVCKMFFRDSLHSVCNGMLNNNGRRHLKPGRPPGSPPQSRRGRIADGASNGGYRGVPATVTLDSGGTEETFTLTIGNADHGAICKRSADSGRNRYSRPIIPAIFYRHGG